MDAKMIEECKGCLLWEKHISEQTPPCSCLVEFPEMAYRCPCVDCLIKPMCKTGCSSYQEFTTRWVKALHSKRTSAHHVKKVKYEF